MLKYQQNPLKNPFYSNAYFYLRNFVSKRTETVSPIIYSSVVVQSSVVAMASLLAVIPSSFQCLPACQSEPSQSLRSVVVSPGRYSMEVGWQSLELEYKILEIHVYHDLVPLNPTSLFSPLSLSLVINYIRIIIYALSMHPTLRPH